MSATAASAAAPSVHAFYATAPAPCRDAWRSLIASRRNNRVAFRDATFHRVAPSGDRGGLVLIACASNGCLYIWDVPETRLELDSGDSVNLELVEAPDFAAELREHRRSDDREARGHAAPFRTCRVQRSGAALSTLQIHAASPGKEILMMGGEEGVIIVDFVAFWNRLLLSPTDTCALDDLKLRGSYPLHLRPYPYPGPSATNCMPDVNDLLVLEDHGLLGAVGDGFGLYMWNIETQQLVKTFNHGSVKTMQTLPHAEEMRSNLILTGGESGRLCLWDMHHEKLVEDMEYAPSDKPTKRGRAAARPRQPCINSLAVQDHNWFTVAGGLADNGGSGAATDQNHGFLSTVSVPTRSVVAYTETRSRPQRARYLPSRLLATVANENAVSLWRGTDLGAPAQRACLSAPSARALAVAPDGRIAVGGVGGTLDLLDPEGLSRTFQFTALAATD